MKKRQRVGGGCRRGADKVKSGGRTSEEQIVDKKNKNWTGDVITVEVNPNPSIIEKKRIE